MFNLQAYRSENLPDILRRELIVVEIKRLYDGTYTAQIGDESVSGPIAYIRDCIKEAIRELKKHIWSLWDDLAHLADIISNGQGHNVGGLQNALFLHSVKHAYALSLQFTDLRHVSRSLRSIFNSDISNIDGELIHKFNQTYLRIRLSHYLLLREMYRLKVIKCYMRNTKVAQISGPWANLDLPMKERVWEWDDEEEEYFHTRDQAKKEQVRYNPETDKYGFYFIWQDLTRDPYRFEDMEEDSPYKSRHLLCVP
jgi:hypothetical protein